MQEDGAHVVKCSLNDQCVGQRVMIGCLQQQFLADA